MVERSPVLDAVFSALSDPTRRDMLNRSMRQELSVGEMAKPYKLTFAAISRHLRVLEKAQLITKQRRGKHFFIHIAPHALSDASAYLRAYERLWNDRLDRLEHFLSLPPSPHGKR